MKLIAKNTVNKILKTFWKNPTNQKIKLMTFKKDRSVELIGSDTETITITEVGFQQATYSNLTITEARHQFKKSFATEFPRSHNVYLEQYKKK